MISWRYHLVSIVAVILAVALGVLAGATVVGDRFVAQLKQRTDLAQQRAAEAEAETARLNGYLKATLPYLTGGKLAGENVVLVTQEPVDGAVYQQALNSLADADATVVAQVTATSRLVSSDAATDLAQAVDKPAVAPKDLVGALAGEVADRLSFGGPRGVGLDVLERASSFVRVDRSPGVALSDIGGLGTIVVVFAGGAGDPQPPIETFLLPLVIRLTQNGAGPVAVGEGLASDYGLVSTVRDDNNDFADGAVVTIDDLDRPYGGVALVLGLANLAAVPNGGGDYGENGSGALPALSPSP